MLHATPLSQRTPQPPQLAVSLEVSTQLPLQIARGAGHAGGTSTGDTSGVVGVSSSTTTGVSSGASSGSGSGEMPRGAHPRDQVSAQSATRIDEVRRIMRFSKTDSVTRAPSAQSRAIIPRTVDGWYRSSS
jgi:hypothetical protein